MSLTNRAIGLSLLAVASLMVTEAQAPPTVSVRITDGTVPPTLAPGGPIGSYLNSDIEQVSVLNGKLNVTVPLLAVGGRGEAGYTITVPVHQPTWSVRVDTFSNDAHCDSTLCHYQFTSDPELVFSDPEYQSGFGPGRILVKHAADGMSACTDSSASPTTHYALRDAISYIVFVSPDGTEHALYDGPNGLDHETFSDSTTCAVALGKDRGRVFKSRDGSGMTYIIDAKQSVVVDYHSPDYQYGATTAPDGTLYMKNGVHYVQAAGQIKRIIDRNGNTVSLTYKSITTGGFVSTYLVDTITDSAGRTIHCDYELPSASLGIAPGYTVDTLNYQTQGGASQTIYVLRASLSSYLVPNSDTNQLLFPNHGGSLYIASVPDALVGILLPHQALTDAPGYQFRYTKYGEIGSVQLPSGGFISYTHGAGLPLGNGVFASGQVLSRLTGSSSAAATGSGGISAKPPWRPFIYRRLLRKDVYQSATDAQVPISWVTYSLPETSGAATLASDNTSYLNVTISTANASGPMVTVTKGGQAVANPVVENHYFLTSSDCTSEGTCSGRVNVSQNIYGPAAKLQYASLNPLTGFNDEWEGKESKTEWPGIKYVERSYGIVNNAALACREDEVHLKVGAAGTSLRKVSQTLYDSNENPTDVYEFPFVSGGSLPNGTSPAGLTGTVCQAVGSGYTRHSKTTFLYTNYAATPISLGTLVQERDVYDAADANLSSRTIFGYDSGTRTPRTDAANWTSPSSNNRGNVTSVSSMVRKLPSGTIETAVGSSFTYDDLGNIVTATDGRGNSVAYAYDDSFSGTATIVDGTGAGGTKSYAFRTKLTLPKSNTSTTLPTTSLEAKTAYDLSLGKPRTFTDVNTVDTAMSYAPSVGGADVYGRPRSLTIASNQSDTRLKHLTTFDYGDTPGNLYVSTKRDQRVNADQILYGIAKFDSLGRKTTTVTGATDKIYADITPDGLNRPASQSNPYRTTADPTYGSASITYDAAGRETSRSLQDGSSITTSYDIDGTSLVLTTDVTEAGVRKVSNTDGLGRLVKVIEYPNRAGPTVPEETTYVYDILDHLTGVTQSTAQTSRTFVTDSAGRLRSATNPESGGTTYEYDLNGNLTSKTEPGFSTLIAYDNWNRPTGKTYTGGNTASVVYCYDGKQADGSLVCAGSEAPGSVGRLTGLGNTRSWTNYTYDPLGRPTGSAQSDSSKSLTYRYWVDGTLAQEVLPSGKALVTCYDSNGRVTWLSKDRTESDCQSTTAPTAAAYAQGFAYAAHGAPKAWTIGNGLQQTADFNNRLQTGTVALGSLWSLRNDYTRTGRVNNGNVWKQHLTFPGVADLVTAYDYDGVNRLTVVEETPTNADAPVCQTSDSGSLSTQGRWCQQFSYDRYGNRTISQQGGVGQGMSALQPASFDAATNRASGGSWHHDLRGDVDVDGAGSKFAYDAEGHMVAICASGVTTCDDVSATPASGSSWMTRFVYDGQGKRVRKDTLAGGTVTAVTYIYNASGELVAEYGGAASSPATVYLTGDHLGTTRVVTGADQSVVARYDYEPFGRELVVTTASKRYSVGGYVPPAAFSVSQKFTGKERDAETGLDWMKTRYFSGAQGRFTSPDKPFADQFPEDPQSWNLYSYVRNNPLKMVDEDGQSATLIGALGGGIIGGAVAAWRGESVWKGAASGAIAGAVAGSVIDTGGASLGVLALSGAAGGLTGGVVSRGLNGEGTTLQQAAVDAAVGGTVGVVLGAGGKVVGAALSRAAATEATAAAVESADAAQAGGRTSGAAAGLRVGNQTFADVSTGGAPRVNHPAVQRALDNVPAAQRSPFHGACAEIGCLNQAANAGVNPQGGTMRAVTIRKPGNANHATPKPACPTCENVQKQMGVN